MLEVLTNESRKLKLCLFFYLGTVFLVVGGWILAAQYETITLTLAGLYLGAHVGQKWIEGKGGPSGAVAPQPGA